ncbi:MAG: acetate/propionate family kinase [Planctomycetales bacterium]
MKILLLNAGSSSLKGSLMESSDSSTIAQATGEWSGSETHYEYVWSEGPPRSETVTWKGHHAAVRRFLADLFHSSSGVAPADLAAVGHRIVHGGPFNASTLITPEVRAEISQLAALAPLHNPPSLEALAAAQAELPDLPHVAVFDTAFHATLPAPARTYPIPEKWTREWGIRRYGFHGLSHAYCARRAVEMLPASVPSRRLIICHLGHGCSATAVLDGQSIDTTMGFTPLEGLMMGTRSGSLDPGILLHLQQHRGLSVSQIDKALQRESGLLGVSGVSADMRQVLAASHEGNSQAALAIEIYTHRIRQAIGALAATLGGVDALVFTAGVGEHAAQIRARVCAGLGFLGLELDPDLNATSHPDAIISASGSRARILIIATREDVTMLREVVKVVSG